MQGRVGVACAIFPGAGGGISLLSASPPPSLCPLPPGPGGCRETEEFAPAAREAQSPIGQDSGQPQARGSPQNPLASQPQHLLPEMWPQSRRHLYMEGSVPHPIQAVCPLLPSSGREGVMETQTGSQIPLVAWEGTLVLLVTSSACGCSRGVSVEVSSVCAGQAWRYGPAPHPFSSCQPDAGGGLCQPWANSRRNPRWL